MDTSITLSKVKVRTDRIFCMGLNYFILCYFVFSLFALFEVIGIINETIEIDIGTVHAYGHPHLPPFNCS